MIAIKESVPASAKTAYRYDIFKGEVDALGKVTKIRSVGSAYVKEGQRTFVVSLKTFLDDRFYMLPETKPERPANYVILTREDSKNLRKKYFWNIVGEAKILEGPNHGLMKLSWDVLSDDLYMSLHPIQTQTATEAEEKSAA